MSAAVSLEQPDPALVRAVALELARRRFRDARGRLERAIEALDAALDEALDAELELAESECLYLEGLALIARDRDSVGLVHEEATWSR